MLSMASARYGSAFVGIQKGNELALGDANPRVECRRRSSVVLTQPDDAGYPTS